MDCAWHALRQWHGTARRDTLMGVVGNRTYLALAEQMVQDDGTDVYTATKALGGLTRADAIGNVFETYATLLIVRQDWDRMCSLLMRLACFDAEGLDGYAV